MGLLMKGSDALRLVDWRHLVHEVHDICHGGETFEHLLTQITM